MDQTRRPLPVYLVIVPIGVTLQPAAVITVDVTAFSVNGRGDEGVAHENEAARPLHGVTSAALGATRTDQNVGGGAVLDGTFASHGPVDSAGAVSLFACEAIVFVTVGIVKRKCDLVLFSVDSGR